MIDLADLFFNPDRFVQRNCCGRWEESLQGIYAYSHLFITFAYITLPLVLLRFEKILQKASNSETLRFYFAAFILSCGVGHLEGVLAFRWPLYHLFALWHAITAIISWATIVKIVQLGLAMEVPDGSSG